MLDPDQTERLVNLFLSLRWPLKEDDGSESPKLKAFGEVLSQLDDVGRELLLTITEDFFWHVLAQYDKSAATVANDLALNHIPVGATVVLLPLIKKEDIGQIKSPSLALPLLRDELKAVGAARELEDLRLGSIRTGQ